MADQTKKVQLTSEHIAALVLLHVNGSFCDSITFRSSDWSISNNPIHTMGLLMDLEKTEYVEDKSFRDESSVWMITEAGRTLVRSFLKSAAENA
jgi:hypothetical protein